jgi:ubiquinone/menaquinone biosynthesis C-methylase UbiE
MSKIHHEEESNIGHAPRTSWLWLELLALTMVCTAHPTGRSISKNVGCAVHTTTKEDALHMIRASEGRLRPVYGPLAQQLVKDLGLKDKALIGIDLGSGPGTLIIELCKRSEGYWIDADINPYFFPYFFQQAEKHGFGGRVGAIEADAQHLPFRDNYADVIVSRGSFWLWKDKLKAFGEILRVLKPGGVAYIGRGFSENLPIEVAKKIRGGQGRGMKYDVAKTAEELRQIMTKLKIKNYRIIRPRLNNKAGVSYGVWVEFHKQN